MNGQSGILKKVLALDKSNVKAWNGIGVTYQLMGDNDSALKCFTKILNIDSTEIQAWISIGFVYQKMFKFKDALKCYNKAKNLVDGRYHHKLYDGLASCLTKLSEFDQAIEILQTHLPAGRRQEKMGRSTVYKICKQAETQKGYRHVAGCYSAGKRPGW